MNTTLCQTIFTGIINIVGAIQRNRPVDNIKKQDRHNDGQRAKNMLCPLRISVDGRRIGAIRWSRFKRMSTTEYIQYAKNDNWPRFDETYFGSARITNILFVMTRN